MKLPGGSMVHRNNGYRELLNTKSLTYMYDIHVSRSSTSSDQYKRHTYTFIVE